jgi:hypothetical protein
MAIKAVNNTISPDGLVLTLLVFKVYPYIIRLSAPLAFIIKRAKAV